MAGISVKSSNSNQGLNMPKTLGKNASKNYVPLLLQPKVSRLISTKRPCPTHKGGKHFGKKKNVQRFELVQILVFTSGMKTIIVFFKDFLVCMENNTINFACLKVQLVKSHLEFLAFPA